MGEETEFEFGGAPSLEEVYFEYGVIFIIAAVLAAIFVLFVVAYRSARREIRRDALKRNAPTDPTVQIQVDK